MASSMNSPACAFPVLPCTDDILTNLQTGYTDTEEETGVTQSGEQETEGPPWSSLPPELLLKIFSHLGDEDKESVESTCQAWGEVCSNPVLWQSQVFSFTGDNCIQLVQQACRSIQRKGYLLRDMTVKIGLPSLPQAWIMSQCVQQLLEFIAHQPGARYIHTLTISRLNFFRHWRFFTISKWNILLAVSSFLRAQRHLQEVNLEMCRLSADDGMKILRALVVGPSRHTIRRLCLHDFFQPKYQATLGNRFSHLVTSSFSTLRHLAVDARHVDSNFLLALLTRSPAKSCVRHLTLHFETSPPREIIAESVWDRIRQLSPELTVTFVFEGRLPFQCAQSILTPSVPLREAVVNWPRGYRNSYVIHQQLADVLCRLTQLYSGVLEKFRLQSNIRASTETEAALVHLANDCRRLCEFRVTVKLSENVLQKITSTLMNRSEYTLIEVRHFKRKRAHTLSPQMRKRSRGVH